MLDIKFIRQNPDTVKDAIGKKGMGSEIDVDALLALDENRRSLLLEVEELKSLRNRVSEEVGHKRKCGEDIKDLTENMRFVSQKIKDLDANLAEVQAEIDERLLWIPNVPHPSAPVGPDETCNVEVKKWGTPRHFQFAPKGHWELGTDLGILDFERAAKITGARFTVFQGMGARLVRAIIAFMIDLHTTEHGYQEVLPPFMVNRDSMIGTGQLPKFEEDTFKLREQDYYLVPTAEVPVTNLHRDEILNAEDLPIYYVAYTPCFRSEAGSHGRDTRGLIRQHQFDKVEMVKFVTPETSYDELEALTDNAAEVLRRLHLPYRIIEMCTGDMGFTQTKKYDVEVWMPSYKRYVEISSCSNFTDFQARRAGIRYRPAQGAKPEFVHTLNGSGLAVGRTLAAIIENCQTADGTVDIPEALQPYMGGLQVVTGASQRPIGLLG
ncbi:MAG: serine--tRNA ligase [Bacillota bacterium]|jgi:seryl-tRNA synthetase